MPYSAMTVTSGPVARSIASSTTTRRSAATAQGRERVWPMAFSTTSYGIGGGFRPNSPVRLGVDAAPRVSQHVHVNVRASRDASPMAVALPREDRRRGRLSRTRVTLDGGVSTAVYVAAYPGTDDGPAGRRLRRRRAARAAGARRAASRTRSSAASSCARRHAARRAAHPRRRRRHVPFAAPWADVRACVHVDGGTARIAQRDELPAQPARRPPAGRPAARARRRAVLRARVDPEGFRPAARQFDSDITDGRHPRAALGLAPGAPDRGRLRRALARATPGSTLEELAARDVGARVPRWRSTSTAAARRRWSAAGGLLNRP